MKDRPKVWQIGDLVDYIRHPHNVNPSEKVEHAGSRNFMCGTHVAQKLEMIALASESVHSKMPVQHWVFSWKEDEQPTRAQVDELVDIFLERMGLVGHQTIYGLHHNTENYHVHIAVNRTHPETLKVVQPHKGFDITEAHKITALVEHKQGWASEENALYTVLENGDLAQRCKKNRVEPRAEAKAFEYATGEKSAQRIAQEKGHSIIEQATSWQELHLKLAEKGLRFDKKGSGAILWVGEVAVKASSVDRAFGMSKLCKRLGEFVPAKEDTPLQAILPEPLSPEHGALWEAYQAEVMEDGEQAQKQIAQAAVEQEKMRQQAERKRVLGGLKKHGKAMLAMGSRALKQEHTKALRQVRRTTRRGKPKPRFGTWLRANGLHRETARWRYNSISMPETLQPLEAPIMPNHCPQTTEFDRYAAAIGAERYRVTCIRMEDDGNKKTFILDKKDGVTKGFLPDEIRQRMPEMLRIQSRGENIYYTPLSAHKHHILLDDMSEAKLAMFLQDGFTPAVILESSPGNFQCLITIPKLGSPFDRDVGNRLTEKLNKQYGDPKLSGCIHPHRAPGFENRKAKHRQENGAYPQVKLLRAEKAECPHALELSKQIAQEYAQAQQERTKRQQTLPQQGATPPGSGATAYYAHLANIQQHLSIEDFSRVDAMIALRMRATGHSRGAVAEIIHQCAPGIREKKEGRNWQRCAERTADYAFGMAGDVDLAKNERFLEHWKRIEGQKEQVADTDKEQPPVRKR